MSIEEQRALLIEKIKTEKDEDVLSSVYHLLEREYVVGEVETIYLTEQQRKGVEKGLEDIANGNVYSDEEVQTRIQKLLND
jgi:predicted transcriptional regulator